jgi:hypothetical protein
METQKHGCKETDRKSYSHEDTEFPQELALSRRKTTEGSYRRCDG